MRYTVTAERGRHRWVLQCEEHPGAISEVARLDQAEENMREAIAFVADVPEQEIQIELRLEGIPAAVAHHLDEADRLRALAEDAERNAGKSVRHALETLENEGYSMRDIGFIVGVSHQRVHQLMHELRDPEVATAGRAAKKARAASAGIKRRGSRSRRADRTVSKA